MEQLRQKTKKTQNNNPTLITLSKPLIKMSNITQEILINKNSQAKKNKNDGYGLMGIVKPQ